MDIGKLTILARGGIYVVAAVPVHPFAPSIVSRCSQTTKDFFTQRLILINALIVIFVSVCVLV